LRVVQGIRAEQRMNPGRRTTGPVREVLQWRRLFDSKMVELTDYGFAAVTRLKVDDQLVAEVEQLGWRLVMGSRPNSRILSGGLSAGSALRPASRATGKSARVGEVTWSVTGLLGREAGTMLAARLLEPVLELEPERRDAHLSVFRSWLAANGSWDATAKELGLHRNSVRRQINAIAELLDMDLGQAQVPCRAVDRTPVRRPSPAA
jgi:purine catabolism regulator